MRVENRRRLFAIRIALEHLEYEGAHPYGRHASLKGTGLEPEDRVLQFYGGGGGAIDAQEQEARLGDWVVEHAPGDFEVVNDARFQLRYKEASAAPSSADELDALDERLSEVERKLAARAELEGGWE